VARRLGFTFGELPIRGETKIGELTQFYELDFGDADPATPVADWAAARLEGRPQLDARLTIPGAELVVRRIESGRIASIGLQIEAMLQVEPDERLFAKLEEDADELGRVRRWVGRLRPGSTRA
jgi:NhaP-type Na+/H+ and K+/H+ antiporter